MTKTDFVRSEHHAFLEATDEALANPGLQKILGRLNATLGIRNRQAWSAFADSDLVRQRARAIKDE
ncbi:MAG: iron-sulfur cluster-binding protein, partial [Pirellulaceae bacterium]